MPCCSKSVSVRILNEEPVHVIPGTSLLLRAHIEFEPQEKVSRVIWERETETGPTPNKVTLATCPGSSGQCTGTKPNVTVKVAKKETTLQINGYKPLDGGVYAVIVSDQNGTQDTGHCIVREYGNTLAIGPTIRGTGAPASTSNNKLQIPLSLLYFCFTNLQVTVWANPINLGFNRF